MPISAATFNRRGKLQRVPITQDHGREVRGEAETIADDVPCGVQYLNGFDRLQAQQLDAKVNVRFILRYRTDLLVSDEFVYGGKTFEIKALIPDEDRRETLTLECVTRG